MGNRMKKMTAALARLKARLSWGGRAERRARVQLAELNERARDEHAETPEGLDDPSRPDHDEPERPALRKRGRRAGKYSSRPERRALWKARCKRAAARASRRANRT